MFAHLLIALAISFSFFASASHASEKTNEIELPDGKIDLSKETVETLVRKWVIYRSSHPELAKKLHEAIKVKQAREEKPAEKARPKVVSEAEFEQYVKEVISKKKGKDAGVEFCTIGK